MGKEESRLEVIPVFDNQAQELRDVAGGHPPLDDVLDYSAHADLNRSCFRGSSTHCKQIGKPSAESFASGNDLHCHIGAD
jgi:hypothetical protein